MPDLEEMTPGQLLADTNVATFIESLGLGIARAQRALDENSLNTAIELATVRPEFSNRSLLDLGFSPTFYHYQHADIEVSLQMTLRVERSFSLNIGLTGSVGHTDAASTQGNGTATITVNFGGGAPARATIRLAEPAAGTLTVGATTVQLQAGAATSPNVGIAPHSLSRTARALADRMSDPPDAVPEVLRALVELVPGGTAITATTDSSTVFNVSQPNTILINDLAQRPARAWLNVTGAGNIQLRGTDTATWQATPSPEQAAVTAIDAVNGYGSRLLFQSGRSVPVVHFEHDHSDRFEPANDGNALEPLIAFLIQNSTQQVRVVGHADQSGEDRHNRTLSEARARFIKDYLIAHGVPATQITEAVGRGEAQPVQGHDHSGQPAAQQRDVANRRVELELIGMANVVLVETVALGATAQWGDNRPAMPAGGTVISARDGANVLSIQGGMHVDVSAHRFLATPATASGSSEHVWTPGATASSAAQALASAILEHAHIDAYAEGRAVRLLPIGSHALLRLESQARNAAANNLTLNATGSLSREAPFSGATEGGEPNAGDTVTIGGHTLTVSTAPTPTGNQFAKGTDAATTAAHLAGAISALPSFTGSASGAAVTVTGISGTRLATSNTGAFALSAAALSGERPSVERSERNTTVAAGLSLDIGYSRRFGVEMTGNSRIAARLVSLPAPVELLDEIRTFLGPNP